MEPVEDRIGRMAAFNTLPKGGTTTCSCEHEKCVPATTHYTDALQALLTTLCIGAEVKTLAPIYLSSGE